MTGVRTEYNQRLKIGTLGHLQFECRERTENWLMSRRILESPAAVGKDGAKRK